jgi:ribosomal protein S18
MTRFDNIKPRKYSQHSVRVQKKLRKAIIRARELGLIAYTQ